MDPLAILAVVEIFLAVLINAIILAEKLSWYRALVYRGLDSLANFLQRIGGGALIFFGVMFDSAAPMGVWNAATRTPPTSTYGFSEIVITSTVSGLLFGIIGLVMICYGIMYAAPDSRLGRRFRRNLKKGDKPASRVLMSYISLLKLGLSRLTLWFRQSTKVLSTSARSG